MKMNTFKKALLVTELHAGSAIETDTEREGRIVSPPARALKSSLE